MERKGIVGGNRRQSKTVASIGQAKRSLIRQKFGMDGTGCSSNSQASPHSNESDHARRK